MLTQEQRAVLVESVIAATGHGACAYVDIHKEPSCVVGQFLFRNGYSSDALDCLFGNVEAAFPGQDLVEGVSRSFLNELQLVWDKTLDEVWDFDTDHARMAMLFLIEAES